MIPQIEGYILDQEEKYRGSIFACRELLMNLHPAMEERYSYRCPFYRYLGAFCYIYISKGHVILGLVRGVDYSNAQGLLVAGDRKQVRHVVITDWTNALQEQVREILAEGLIIQESRNELKLPNWGI